MKNNVENSMIDVSKKSIFERIKIFLKSMLKKQTTNYKQESSSEEVVDMSTTQESFIESIKANNDEINLLELQELYEKDEIILSQISEEQAKALLELYKKQVSELEISNEKRKQKLLEYKKN